MNNRRKSLPKQQLKKLPVMISACFFVISLTTYAVFFLSPREQAKKAVREEYTWYKGENTENVGVSINIDPGNQGVVGHELLDRPEYDGLLEKNHRIERVSVRDVSVFPADGDGGETVTYTYHVDYDIVLNKGAESVTPVFPASAEGEVSMEKNGAGWKAAAMKQY